MNVEIGAEAALFPEKEYINGIAVAVWFQEWECIPADPLLQKLSDFSGIKGTKTPFSKKFSEGLPDPWSEDVCLTGTLSNSGTVFVYGVEEKRNVHCTKLWLVHIYEVQKKYNYGQFKCEWVGREKYSAKLLRHFKTDKIT